MISPSRGFSGLPDELFTTMVSTFPCVCSSVELQNQYIYLWIVTIVWALQEALNWILRMFFLFFLFFLSKPRAGTTVSTKWASGWLSFDLLVTMGQVRVWRWSAWVHITQPRHSEERVWWQAKMASVESTLPWSSSRRSNSSLHSWQARFAEISRIPCH